MKRWQLIVGSVVLVLLIAGGVTAALYLTKKPSSSASTYDPTKPSKTFSGDAIKQEAQTTPDLSKDLGACDVVTTSAISDNLALVATNLQAADNRGVGHQQNGDTTQNCVYSFTKDETGNNRLTVSITAFANSSNQSTAQTAYSGISSVTVDKGTAYFSTIAGTDTLPQDSYVLDVFNGQKQIEFMVTVPKTDDPYTSAKAQTALIALAKAATY